MSLRLRNDNNPKKTLGMSREAWCRILELAEDFGWNPVGTILPAWYQVEPDFSGYDPHSWNGANVTGDGRLVLLEDALNLADALERAFLEYEPERTPVTAEISVTGRVELVTQLQPSLGAITAVVDFSRQGAFWIERYVKD